MGLPRAVAARKPCPANVAGPFANLGTVRDLGETMAIDKEAVAARTAADGTVILESPRGSARLTRPVLGVLLFVCDGVLSAGFYAPMVELADREVKAKGSLVMIVDGWDLRSVETGFREAWTEWFKLHRQHFQMRLLVRSKLMDMAASIANLFTGTSVIKTYSNVVAWERACSDALPGFCRLSKASA